MPKFTDTAPFVLKEGELIVKRDKILLAMAEFDRRGLRDRGWYIRNGWSIVEENGNRYDPKWILKLATGEGLTTFKHIQARETLSALGFKLHFDPDWRSKKVHDLPPPNGEDDPEGEEAEKANELTFDIERNLQSALRANIEQLETGLRITDGSHEKKVDSGFIDITAEDRNGTTVVVELKVGEAGRRAIGQILAYMGDFIQGKKPIRGILVAGEFSPQAISAARVVPNLQLRKYRFKFAFEIVEAS